MEVKVKEINNKQMQKCQNLKNLNAYQQGKGRALINSTLFVHLGEAHLVAICVFDFNGRHANRPQGVSKVRIDGKEEQRLDEEGQLREDDSVRPKGIVQTKKNDEEVHRRPGQVKDDGENENGAHKLNKQREKS